MEPGNVLRNFMTRFPEMFSSPSALWGRPVSHNSSGQWIFHPGHLLRLCPSFSPCLHLRLNVGAGQYQFPLSVETPSPAVLSDLPSPSFFSAGGHMEASLGQFLLPCPRFCGEAHANRSPGQHPRINYWFLGQLLRGRSPGRRVAGPISGQLLLPCPSSAVVRGFVLQVWGNIEGQVPRNFSLEQCTWEASGSRPFSAAV